MTDQHDDTELDRAEIERIEKAVRMGEYFEELSFDKPHGIFTLGLWGLVFIIGIGIGFAISRLIFP